MSKTTELISNMEEYIAEKYVSKTDVPTIAGLCASLGLTKEDFFALEQKNKKLSLAVKRVKYLIEHYFISRSALKLINNTTAHFYLNNALGYGKDSDEPDTAGELEFKIISE